jgi:L-lactate dehydrogenase complex protein LldG
MAEALPRLVERFIDRVEDYRATVVRVAPAGLAGAIAHACGTRGIGTLAVPADVPPDWLAELDAAGTEILRAAPGPGSPAAAAPADENGATRRLSPADLDDVDGALTGCALAIAETGTLVLDGGAAQGRRVVTLIPDTHLCVVHADQIVGSVPDATAVLRDAALAGRPLTLISGPSATSDIELSRVEGVHGPRTLVVLIVDPAA